MTKRSSNEITKVSHFVGLSGLGGVQRNFAEYINSQSDLDNGLLHKVYTLGKVDFQYKILAEVYNIINLINLFSLVSDIVSKTKIIHFYNNLTSLKVAFLLFFLPTSNLIVHERGSAWNLPSKNGFILRFIAWKSDLILANSRATKALLEEKFGIPKNKIKVLHNGVNILIDCKKKLLQKKEDEETFFIGFIGRLDTPKGVHVLIDAMHNLINENIKLIIAGEGPLRQELEDRANNLKSVQFIGRIKDTNKFYNRIDLLVVPSIREPFGNICIEAGLCKVPVLASYVDGIPEIIDNYTSGELIKPARPVTYLVGKNSLPLPEYVIDPVNFKLIKPMQIDSSELADKILLLSNNPKALSKYANTLHKKIINNFSIEQYSIKLHNIYTDLMGTK